jgi:hypothetical protein
LKERVMGYTIDRLYSIALLPVVALVLLIFICKTIVDIAREAKK